MTHPARIFISSAHPLFSMFDVEFLETSSKILSIKFMAQKEFVACEETKHMHSSFCSLILDSVMGGAVMGSLGKIQPIATINLTTQHSARPVLGEDIVCTGNVVRIEDHVAAVTGQVISVKSGETYATALGSFMIGTRAVPLQNSNGAKR